MSLGHLSAIAVALLGAVVVAGCGLGPGPSIGDVSITVTRDYGSRLLVRRSEANASVSETAMRLLDRSAKITTRYGGGFVQSIDGLSGGQEGGRELDWFFYVNGVEAPVGAADYPLHGGYRVWWDYRDWTAAMRVPAVVGAFPEPFLHGYEGKAHPVEVKCMGGGSACRLVRKRLARELGRKRAGDPIRVLVGPWSRVREDSAAGLIGRGPANSGVFADFVPAAAGWKLEALDMTGNPKRVEESAGLVAATRAGDAPPTWVVTGTDGTTLAAAARLLDSADLRDRYAVATSPSGPVPLPLR